MVCITDNIANGVKDRNSGIAFSELICFKITFNTAFKWRMRYGR